jgi:hypothetical protein
VPSGSSAPGPGGEAEGLDHGLEVLRAAGDPDGFLVVDPVFFDQLQQRLVQDPIRSYSREVSYYRVQRLRPLLSRSGLIPSMNKFVCATCGKERGSLPMDLTYPFGISRR